MYANKLRKLHMKFIERKYNISKNCPVRSAVLGAQSDGIVREMSIAEMFCQLNDTGFVPVRVGKNYGYTFHSIVKSYGGVDDHKTEYLFQYSTKTLGLGDICVPIAPQDKISGERFACYAQTTGSADWYSAVCDIEIIEANDVEKQFLLALTSELPIERWIEDDGLFSYLKMYKQINGDYNTTNLASMPHRLHPDLSGVKETHVFEVALKALILMTRCGDESWNTLDIGQHMKSMWLSMYFRNAQKHQVTDILDAVQIGFEERCTPAQFLSLLKV